MAYWQISLLPSQQTDNTAIRKGLLNVSQISLLSLKVKTKVLTKPNKTLYDLTPFWPDHLLLFPLAYSVPVKLAGILLPPELCSCSDVSFHYIYMVPFFVTTRSLLKYLFEVHHYNFLHSSSHSLSLLYFFSSTSHHLIYILIKFLYCLPSYPQDELHNGRNFYFDHCLLCLLFAQCLVHNRHWVFVKLIKLIYTWSVCIILKTYTHKLPFCSFPPQL